MSLASIWQRALHQMEIASLPAPRWPRVARRLLKVRNRTFFALDLVLLPLALYFSFVLRLGQLNLGPFVDSFVQYVILMLALLPGVFVAGRIYSRYWQYASTEDVV